MTPGTSPELRDAFAALGPYLRRAAWFTLAAGLLVLAPSGYMLEVYERVVNSRNAHTLLMLTVLVLAAFVVMEVVEWTRARVLREAGLLLDKRLADRVFTAVFQANQRRLPGGTSQSMSDLRTLREFLSSPAVHALMEAPVALTFLVLVYAIHPLLGVAATIGAVVQGLVSWANERTSQPPLAAASQSAIAAQVEADAAMRSAGWIDAMGMGGAMQRRWLDKHRKFLEQQAQASDAAGGWQAVTRFLQTTMGSLLIGLGAWVLLRGSLQESAGLLIVASILGGRVLSPFSTILSHWRGIVQFREAYKRLEQLLTMVPPARPAMPLPPPRGLLAVENVLASAPGTALPIIKGVTLVLQPGELLAVIGPSASGKTTLARLLVGLWPANAGKVRLDGADVHAWDKTELGPRIGYLPQDVELLEGTVAENIARFGVVDPAAVEAAARSVGLHELILALPQGYDTLVGAGGAALSAGQRQRVGLARALYGDPVFVVLDEPNASLDEAGDAALVATLEALKKKRNTTVVIITHRMSALAAADKLLVLRDGQVQGLGPRDEVLKAMHEAAKPPAARRPAAPPLKLQLPATT
jgi:ATP-binding cassette subfamily C exporter for protease/lipase